MLVDAELLGADAELLEDVVAGDVGDAQAEGGGEDGELHSGGGADAWLGTSRSRVSTSRP